MEKTIRLTVNGTGQEVAAGTTVGSLMCEKQIRPEAVVVEVNLDIIPRERYGSTVLLAGDTVEVLHFVGGG